MRGFKYGHQIDMYLNDIELCANRLSTILSSTLNIIGRTHHKLVKFTQDTHLTGVTGI